MSSELEILVGKVIKEIELYGNKDGIIFSGEDFYYQFNAEAECCSASWIERLEDQENVIGYPVLKVETMEGRRLEHEKDDSDYDVLECFAYEIYTEKGICRIEFRNESNGYYCGWLELDKVNSAGIGVDSEAGN